MYPSLPNATQPQHDEALRVSRTKRWRFFLQHDERKFAIDQNFHLTQRRTSSRFRRSHLAACRRRTLRGHGRNRGNAGMRSGCRGKLHCAKPRRRCHKDALGNGLQAPSTQQPLRKSFALGEYGNNIGADENVRRPRNGATWCALRGSGKPAQDRARGLPQQRRGVGRRCKGLGTRDRVTRGGGTRALGA